MNQIQFITEQVRRSLEADPWHGPALLQVLNGVTAPVAAAHPVRDSHSIWELLLHVIAWTRAVNLRLQGRAVELDGDANFPPVHDASEAAWKAALDDLGRAHDELFASLKGLSDSALTTAVQNRPYDYAFLLHGLPQHHAYHGGQMALLKKAAMSGEGVNG
jgi:hypothetical protein